MGSNKKCRKTKLFIMKMQTKIKPEYFNLTEIFFLEMNFLKK